MNTEEKSEKEILDATQSTPMNEEQDNEATENTVNETEETPENTETDKLAQLQNELEEYKDKYIRQVAEFDNYRKRTLKEKTQLILNGGEKVLTALLPVLDDLDRAIENIEKCDDVANLKEGVTLIMDKLSKTLNAQGLQRMDVIGKEFDTDFQEAIALIPTPDESQKNHVIDCVQPGYMLNEKVLRHAKVVVGQ